MRAIACVAALAVFAPAQTTWIVDAAGGGNFVQVSAAYDFASPGDTILVRAGTYAGFTRNPEKGVRILGDGGGAVIGPTSLSNMPANQTLHLGGIAFAEYQQFNSVTAMLQIVGCDRLVMHDVDVTGLFGWSSPNFEGGLGLWLQDCRGVLADVRVVGGDAFAGQRGMGAFMISSELALSGCEFSSGGGASIGNDVALRVGFSSVALDECVVTQGTPAYLGALYAVAGRVLVSNRQNSIESVYAASFTTGTTIVEIAGTMPPLGSGSVPVIARDQPGLTGLTDAPIGGSLVWSIHGTAGYIGAAAVSLGIEPVALPGLFDTTLFTLGYPSASLFAPFTIGATGTATYSLPIPALPALVDTHVFLQAGGWLGQPTWKATGVAVTRIR
jgi:hypothetical protein